MKRTPAELRRLAEQRLRELAAPLPDTALERELTVLRMELEIRNEELTDTNAALGEANAALRLSEARWHAVFDDAPVAYFTLDPRGHVVEVNRAATSLVDRRHGDVVGRHLMEFVPRAERDAFHGFLLGALEGRAVQVRTLIDRRGACVPVQVQALPVGDADVGALRVVFTNLSELHEAHRELGHTLAMMFTHWRPHGNSGD